MQRLTGRSIRVQTAARLLTTRTQLGSWKIRFTNLVSGRFTELLFERSFRPKLESLRLQLHEETGQRNYLDYRISADPDFEIGINLKNAGVQYRESAKWVGLHPEDTLPIATYKIFGSEVARIPPLIYVFLVDWTLLERLRAIYWTKLLNDQERAVFRFIARARAIPRNVEDAFIDGTAGRGLARLTRLLGYASLEPSELPFRAISAGKCRRIFYDHHDRSPYVYRRRMNTDPNVHISVSEETLSFAVFVDKYLASAKSRRDLLTELRHTIHLRVVSPSV